MGGDKVESEERRAERERVCVRTAKGQEGTNVGTRLVGEEGTYIKRNDGLVQRCSASH